MTMTRFDLKYAFSILFQYYLNLNSIYVKATIQLLRYVKEILHLNIHYKNKENLMNYIDADWIEAIVDKRLIEEYVYFLFEDFISWSFKRQNCVT